MGRQIKGNTSTNANGGNKTKGQDARYQKHNEGYQRETKEEGEKTKDKSSPDGSS